MVLAVGAHIGPYRIEGRLGAGGMGEVYRAVQVHLQRVVALKVMKPELAADRDFVERFMREARAGAALSHPHVVAIHDADNRDGLLYLAFEYVSGGDLAQLLAARGPLPAGEALRLIAECADGLQAIHAAGMLHRDLKPQNIFLDGAGRAKLGDLGLARSAVGDDRMTVTGAAMGTPAFMAPEQAEGVADIDIRADIHALGGTLYTLLTGQLPFTAATPWAVVAKVMSQPPPDPRAVAPGLPAEVAALVQRAMAKRREDRFATPAELRAEVLRVAGNLGQGTAGSGGTVALPPTPATGSAAAGSVTGGSRAAGSAASSQAEKMAPTVVTTHGLPPPPAPASGPAEAFALATNQPTQHPTVPPQRGAPVAVLALALVAVIALAAIAVTWLTAPAGLVGHGGHGGSATSAVVVNGDAHTATEAVVAVPVVVAATAAAVEVPIAVQKPVDSTPVAVKADDRGSAAAARDAALAAKRAPLLVLDTAVTPPADIETSLDLYAVVVGPDDADLKRWRGKIAAIRNLRQDLGTTAADTGLRAGDAAMVAKLDQLTTLVGADDPDVVTWRQLVDGPPTPAWAGASGKDDHGRWCELTVNGVVQRMRLCRGGGFTMGSPADEPGHVEDEVAHHVVVSDFWMADTPCTQQLWVAVMGTNPSHFSNDAARPVEQVSWNDTQVFLGKLTQLATGHSPDATAADAAAVGATTADATADATAADATAADATATDASVTAANATVDLLFRLPTEAEWEYACRAGTTGAYGGDGVIADMGWTVPAEAEALWAKAVAGGSYDEIGNFLSNHGGTGGYQTRAVRMKQANAWGLYDMHGNVWQWCQDAYKPYDAANNSDPVVAPDADHKTRVNRGGGWSHPAVNARSAARAADDPTLANWAVGFRFVVSADTATP